MRLLVPLVLCVALPRCTCAGVCEGPQDCAPGDACVDGSCSNSGVSLDDVTITDVDGDGAELPTDVPAGVDDPRPAPRRIGTALVVSGTSLDQVLGAHLEGADATHTLDIESASGDTMRLTLPGSLAPGLFTLVLVSATDAARAQVFVLQGEPGLTSLTVQRPSSVCATGGIQFASGLDADRDGLLDPDEQAAVDDVCNGDSIFSCAGGLCDTEVDLRVRGQPVVRSLAPELAAIGVPSEAATVAEALAQLDGLLLTSDVTIVIEGVLHEEPAAIVIDHPGAAFIHIVGAEPDAGTTLLVEDDNGIIVDGGRFGGVANLTITGNDDPSTTGVFVTNGGVTNLTAPIVISHFGGGIVAVLNSVINAPFARAEDNLSVGFSARAGAFLNVGGGVATGNLVGLGLDQGSTADANDIVVVAGQTGVSVSNDSSAQIIASSITVTGSFGVVAGNNSHIIASSSAFTATVNGALANTSSSIVCSPCTISPAPLADTSSIIVGP